MKFTSDPVRLPMNSDTKQIYTISEINRRARTLLETEFSGIWVEGEISNFKHHSSGHMYLSLKDDGAQISACLFSRYNQNLKFIPKDGLKVLAFGKISLYEQRGQFQFYIERLEPKGIGALQLAFLQLKEKLEKEGLFKTEHKKLIPKYPSRIGIITSPTGAAIQDMLNVIRRRFHGTQILLFPVRVQGDGAAAEIVAAIDEMNKHGQADVLIIGRGGGSIEDLWAFNEEIVARAIYRSQIPIISAVGHEIDWTISDFVADMRAPTPSAAAELVVQNRDELEVRFLDFQTRMRSAVLNFLDIQKQRLKSIESSYAFKQPLLLVDQFSQRLDDLLRQLQNYLRAALTQKTQTLQQFAGRLHALSPLAVLERGYSITFDEHQNISKTIKKIKMGDTLITRLLDGEVLSKVLKTVKKEEKNHG